MRKTNFNSFLTRSLGMLFILAVSFSACKEDEPAPVNQKADFASSSTSVSEDAGEASTVTINFDKALASDSELSITLDNAAGVEYTTHYITNPNGSSGTITLSVAKGASNVSFTVTPIDDTVENDARVITMTLASATGSLEVGTATTHTFTITDNDVPASVNFAQETSTVPENTGTPYTVQLNLTTAAVNAGTFDVTITSANATYTNDYTTNPDGSTGTITLSVAAEALEASFTVSPVDNSSVGDDRIITFAIENATGGVNIGQLSSHVMTITEDDNPTLKTIADLRTLYGDGSADVSLAENWMIQGTVTSTNDAVTSRNLFIQDATAGIAIRWDETHTFTQGDNLTVKLQGSTLSDFNALVQIGGTMPLANGTVDSQSNTITPATVTFAQLNTGDYESQFVEILNVTFADADGIATVRSNNTGNDGADDGQVRVESYAPFVDDILPFGTGTVKGIAGTYQGTAQVLPQVASDFFANNPSSTITITGTIDDFGSVETNVASASQSFTVAGTGLTEDITVTAPDQFAVSLNDVDFSSTVAVASADAMAAPVTVYVHFAPTTGFANTFTGDVINATSGAVTQTVAVTGTEAPIGGGTTLLMADDFDYGSAAGDLTTLTSNWVKSSGTAPLGYITTSLSMTDYASSGIGGSVAIIDPDGSAEDASRTYAKQSSGAVYASALVNIASFNAGGDDYFFHLRNESGAFFARFYAKDEGGNLKFGIRENSTSGTVAQYSASNYSYNTTYLVVVKYEFSTGTASIYVLDNAAATEPATADSESSDGVDPLDLAQVGIRQGNDTPVGVIDGVRIATDWAGLIGN